ncbi:MAPEG family protein [Pseudoalteromonas luteoviolacea]|uniref:MAPEG family protein n=1 Tax=Pseudoalteromonas luteoviolacea TaxID=43657 RepID=UPI001B39F4EE|nr:MAPEG family protein [Pseudoalteromonas luteoviolacea]MBQ4880616.1 MAPEG family protein [Pseudoalteromonas luteoviolacea]MBQ4909656.1 MAPEG family protein [Pseudoalteromonas luteoviolacea]
MELFEQYQISILVIGLSGLMFLVQLLVADVVSIKKGQIPGTIVEQSHDNFLFRSSRAIANSNETVGIFILFLMFAFLSSSNSSWVNISAMVYFVGRLGHMVFYYANLKVLRSVAFGVALIGLVSIFLSGLVRWF